MVHKALPVVPVITTLKVLLYTPESLLSVPIIKSPEPIQKKEEPIPFPKPKQIQTSTPIKTPVLVQSKPIPIAPQTTPTLTPTAKAPEITAQAAPKAPPPPPKVEENYTEENLGRIRTILAERLKYPKNALRLKQQGETTVTFTLDTNRDVSQITITQSSGFELLDDAAEKLIESSASLFPKPAKSVRISVPIAYKLR